MKTLILTNEYPPNIYGGAGVHVDYLSNSLATMMDVEVRCFGTQDIKAKNLRVSGHTLDENYFEKCPAHFQPVFKSLSRCVSFNTDPIDADVVHCHTWYSHFGGIAAKLAYGIPLVITIHSLEPLRP
ncbi:MAG: glycosyltransferase, partial [Verrucomicrobiota bacterium]|nr:glycosyltransferase [Verrucomicrobiota bacterium]